MESHYFHRGIFIPPGLNGDSLLVGEINKALEEREKEKEKEEREKGKGI